MIYLLDLFGIAVFAISGALAAGRKRMDVFGIVVVAIVTAIGGGTIRDLLLGIRPVFWIDQPAYIIVATASAVATFIAARFIRPPERLLLLFDAFGLALFTVLGCQRASALDVPAVTVVLMGILTGSAGGVVRDLLCGEIPSLLRREIYATASLLGGVALIVMERMGMGARAATIVPIGIVLVVRLAALYWRLSLPVFESRYASDDHG